MTMTEREDKDIANGLITKKGYKTGMKVRIAKDISITRRRHSLTKEMREMSDSDRSYKISGVAYGHLVIDGYMWAPEDILMDNDDEPDSLPKTEIMFDPNELVI